MSKLVASEASETMEFSSELDGKFNELGMPRAAWAAAARRVRKGRRQEGPGERVVLFASCQNHS